jgi:hypothetical protein
MILPPRVYVARKGNFRPDDAAGKPSNKKQKGGEERTHAMNLNMRG